MPAAEKAFPQTPVNVIEIKVLPAARLIATQTEQSYFENNGRLFRPLFRYIQGNDISMTTPVEAEIAPGVMYFHIGSDATKQVLESTDEVSVYELPERTVASIGARGSYSEANFREAAAELNAWLKTDESYQAAGSPRAIFWNGPYVPGILKRFEVHIPVEKR